MTQRLLIVVNDAGFFLSHRLSVALAAKKAGYEVFIATPDGKAVVDIIGAGLKWVTWPMSRGGMHPLHEALSLWTLMRIILRLRPDIIHLVTIKPVLYGGALARLLRVPAMVAAISGMGYLFVEQSRWMGVARRLAEAVYRFAFGHPNSCVIVQNQDDEATLHAIGALRQNQSRLIKGSGVDLDQFSPQPLTHDIPLVVLPARMLWDKGVGEFVEAANLLKNKGIKIRMVLVGPHDPDNPAAVPLIQLEEWRNKGPVEWWGYRNNMSAILAESHLVALPSYYREGIPKSLLEAAASGRAIVTTDSRGCREVVEHGVNGLLVPPRNAVALADAILSLINDRDRLAEMGRRGREKAEEEFGIEGVVRAHIALYQDLFSHKAESV